MILFTDKNLLEIYSRIYEILFASFLPDVLPSSNIDENDYIF